MVQAVCPKQMSFDMLVVKISPELPPSLGYGWIYEGGMHSVVNSLLIPTLWITGVKREQTTQ